jgi:hypothetical protein
VKKPVILAISDLQIPFEHRDALAFTQHVARTYTGEQNWFEVLKKIEVVNMGDEVDQHTLSRWPKDPNGRSAGDECEEAKHRLRDWYLAYPHTKICKSNHSYRVFKVASEAGIPQQFLKSLQEAYEAPETWLWGPRWMVQDICFEHGENVSGNMAALNAALQNRCSTVIGHQHKGGGVTYSRSIANQIWGLNTGCLIDEDTYAFKYGQDLRQKPTLGCGVIVNGIPHFIPMILDKRKRWVGRVYEMEPVR